MNELLHTHPNNDRCLTHGMLVSLYDGEATEEERLHVQEHLAHCPECAALERLVSLRHQEVGQTLALLDPLEQQSPKGEQAFARFQARLDHLSPPSEPERSHVTRLPSGSLRAVPRRKRLSVANKLLAAVAVVLLLLVALPNASAWANAFLTLFQVQQVQPVSIDLPAWRQQILQELQHFGTLQIQQDEVTSATHLTPTQAEQITHVPLVLPTHLPAGVDPTPRVSIIAGGEATFVFQQATAAHYLAQLGESGVTIPPQLEGATFQVTFAPGAALTYIGKAMLVLKEVPSPMVRGSTPSALTTLQQFLLAVPHLPTELRALVSQLNQANGSVPLPLPEPVQAQAVTVQGAPGLLLSEAGVTGGILIWLKHGMVYTMASSGAARDIPAIAASLT